MRINFSFFLGSVWLKGLRRGNEFWAYKIHVWLEVWNNLREKTLFSSLINTTNRRVLYRAKNGGFFCTILSLQKPSLPPLKFIFLSLFLLFIFLCSFFPGLCIPFSFIYLFMLFVFYGCFVIIFFVSFFFSICYLFF